MTQKHCFLTRSVQLPPFRYLAELSTLTGHETVRKDFLACVIRTFFFSYLALALRGHGRIRVFSHILVVTDHTLPTVYNMPLNQPTKLVR